MQGEPLGKGRQANAVNRPAGFETGAEFIGKAQQPRTGQPLHPVVCANVNQLPSAASDRKNRNVPSQDRLSERCHPQKRISHGKASDRFGQCRVVDRLFIIQSVHVIRHSDHSLR